MDAANLAWKLALVTQGSAPDRLLDTYGQERAPEAFQTLRFTDRLVGLMTLRHPVKRTVRDTVLPAVTRLPAIQRRAARGMSQVSVAYRTGALVRPDHGGGLPKPGESVPDVEVSVDGRTTRLHEVLRDGRHVLLVAGLDAGSAATPAAVAGMEGRVDVVDGRLDAARGCGAFALVRPDGFLAARGSRRDTARLVDYLHRLGTTPAPAVFTIRAPGSRPSRAAARTAGS